MERGPVLRAAAETSLPPGRQRQLGGIEMDLEGGTRVCMGQKTRVSWEEATASGQDGR